MYMYIQYSMHVNVISIVLFYNITPTIRQINNMILFILMSYAWFFEVCQFMERRVTHLVSYNFCVFNINYKLSFFSHARAANVIQTRRIGPSSSGTIHRCLPCAIYWSRPKRVHPRRTTPLKILNLARMRPKRTTAARAPFRAGRRQ